MQVFISRDLQRANLRLAGPLIQYPASEREPQDRGVCGGFVGTGRVGRQWGIRGEHCGFMSLLFKVCYKGIKLGVF